MQKGKIDIKVAPKRQF